MKKTLLLVILFLFSMACTISLPGSSFDKDVAVGVGVALALTETALQESEDGQSATDTPQPEAEITLTPTTTRTPPADDPKTVLGNSNWRDTLSDGKNWQLESGDVTYGDTTFSHANGKLTAVNSVRGDGMIWYLTYLDFEDAYLEATFEIEDCSASDQYGLIVRAADYNDGIAYYYIVTCGGQYDLRRWNLSGSTLLLNSLSSDVFNNGSNQSNTLGIWIEGDIIRLYANNQFLTEVQDNSITGEGHFGLFSNAVQTSNFTIHMDEIAYWLID